VYYLWIFLKLSIISENKEKKCIIWKKFAGTGESQSLMTYTFSFLDVPIFCGAKRSLSKPCAPSTAAVDRIVLTVRWLHENGEPTCRGPITRRACDDVRRSDKSLQSHGGWMCIVQKTHGSPSTPVTGHWWRVVALRRTGSQTELLPHPFTNKCMSAHVLSQILLTLTNFLGKNSSIYNTKLIWLDSSWHVLPPVGLNWRGGEPNLAYPTCKLASFKEDQR
jgi:hypothetical protein